MEFITLTGEGVKEMKTKTKLNSFDFMSLIDSNGPLNIVSNFFYYSILLTYTQSHTHWTTTFTRTTLSGVQSAEVPYQPNYIFRRRHSESDFGSGKFRFRHFD